MLLLFAPLRSVLRRVVLANMECFLICNNKSHARIYLPDQKAVVVGRTPATEIQDKKLSRKQGIIGYRLPSFLSNYVLYAL